MHDLKSKLEFYMRNHSSDKSDTAEEKDCDIQDMCQGTVFKGENGSCFVSENCYPISYIHGGHRLGDAYNINMADMKKICADIDKDLTADDFLFLDTETTGLSGGTGTVAFLVGIGFFKEESFIIRQYFMRDYDEEPAMLEALSVLMSEFKALVTFNGKAFDWNLLTTRYIFNRMKPGLKNPSNLDLLFPSRRLWRLKLKSCSLSSLEENILGEYRVDDIPGALIPSIYFKYLENRDAKEIVRVMRHNELDILSMIPLMIKMALLLENPMSDEYGKQELIGLGRIFEANGEYNKVVECLESCMTSDDYMVKNIAVRRLSGIYKRSGNYDRAIKHWKRMLSDQRTLDIYPIVELAKYYEHRAKDFRKALELVDKAISMTLRTGLQNNIYYADLIKRRTRLRKKEEKSNNEREYKCK